MKDNEILDSLKRSIDEASIDLLDNLKSQKVVKMIKHDNITRQERKIPLKPIMSFASIAAMFILVFFYFQQLRMPDSEIYLDVNPGIHITTNSRDEIIKLEGINQEAMKIIDDVEYKDRNLNEVTEEILDLLLYKEYIDEEDEVMLLSVFNKDKEKSKKQANDLNELIHTKLDDVNMNPILLTQSLERSSTIKNFADKYGISVGKMTFIRNMIILNPDLQTEDLVNLTLRELVQLSQDTGIDIERIIEGSDMDRITESEPESEPEPEPEPEPTPESTPEPTPAPTPSEPSLIGETRAREIALGRANGRIVDFELEWDDGRPEYKIEIVAGRYEYVIEIHGYTGDVLDIDRDELDDDDDDDDDDND